jgi:acyl-CoA dehydrogenase
MTVLTHERNGESGATRNAGGGVLELIRRAGQARRGSGVALDSAAVRAKLAQWWVEEQGLKIQGLRVRAALARGEPAPPTVAINKLVYATKLQQTNAFAMDLDEADGLMITDERPDRDGIFFQYIWSAALRIAGGADEILRNQLAERALGMPSEPRMDKIPFDQLPG